MPWETRTPYRRRLVWGFCVGFFMLWWGGAGPLRTRWVAHTKGCRVLWRLRSNAEAANYGGPTAVRKLQRSGKRFAHQLSGHGCRRKFAWYPVQCAAAAPMSYPGGEIQGRGTPPPLAASFFPDSFFAGEERIGPRRALNRLFGRHWHGKDFQTWFSMPRGVACCFAKQY